MPETDTQQIVNKAWSFAHVLRDDGLSYMAYTEQITFLLFLKMAYERTQPPWNRDSIVPEGLDWPSLLNRDGEELESHYRHILRELGTQSGMLGEIFKKARQEIQNPATLKRLIVDLIGPESWMSMHADVKGDIYEGLLSKSAQESPKGAGQYFTPRQLIKGIVDVMQPRPDDTVCDPACGDWRLPACGSTTTSFANTERNWTLTRSDTYVRTSSHGWETGTRNRSPRDHETCTFTGSTRSRALSVRVLTASRVTPVSGTRWYSPIHHSGRRAASRS